MLSDDDSNHINEIMMMMMMIMMNLKIKERWTLGSVQRI